MYYLKQLGEKVDLVPQMRNYDLIKVSISFNIDNLSFNCSFSILYFFLVSFLGSGLGIFYRRILSRAGAKSALRRFGKVFRWF